jgi:hypothetical protein
MTSTSPDTDAFYILGGMFSVYVLIGGLIFYYLSNGLNKSGEDTPLKKLIGLPFLPAFLFWIIVMGCFACVYWWVYPEMHRTVIDFEGTDEEKRKLEEYRRNCRKIGLCRRLAAKVGLAQDSRPEWPFTRPRT